jgi:hypothetical protein
MRRVALLMLALVGAIGVAGAAAQAVSARPRDEARARRAFDEAAARLDAWLGPSSARPDIHLRDRWRVVPSTMEVESEVAYQLARSRWPAAVDPSGAALLDGVAWYLQSRIIETLFDQQLHTNGYAMDRAVLFGGAWVQAFNWLPVSRWSAGIGRGDYGPSAPLRARGAQAFATLERYLTWPILQRALAAWAAQPAIIDLDGVARIVGSAAGQDLGWFFAVAFDPAQTVDYRVASVVSHQGGDCGTPSCYRTRVGVARIGAAAFAGSAADRFGRYHAGDAVEIAVLFADQSRHVVRWDGRDRTASFDVDAAAPAVAATIDPGQVILLDRNLLDNTLRVNPARDRPVLRWIARWLIWFQDAMLTIAT